MKKRVLIVHGWDGHPNANWYPWLKKRLIEKGFDVIIPQFPDPEAPEIESWVGKLAEEVGRVDNKTYFVGHSIGCQTIVRYIETLPNPSRAGGAIFVGGFFKRLSNEEDDEENKKIAATWLNTPINFDKVKKIIGQSVAIFSDNDPDVPLDNKDDFEKKLNSEIVVVHNMYHFDEGHGIYEVPIILEKLLQITK